jgi:hypothetical protein
MKRLPAPTRSRGDVFHSNFRKLRRRCEARVRKLPLPVPFEIGRLCRLLAEQRERPIHLRPMSACDSGVLGMWVAIESADLIFYEERTTPPHQEHIILHELGHLLCNHIPAERSLGEQVRLLLPDLDPDMVRKVLGRGGYRAAEEQEAELLATLIRDRAYRVAQPRRETNAVADRIRAGFDWPGPGRG